VGPLKPAADELGTVCFAVLFEPVGAYQPWEVIVRFGRDGGGQRGSFG
jgi:hypothetical protein